MKKLIVLFLVVCSCGIYFIGSSCDDDVPSNTIANDGCTFYSLPKVDFTTAKTEYFVGDPVTFTFTGTTGSKDDKSVTWSWVFRANVTNGYLFSDARNPVVTFIAAGTYNVDLKVYNPCWMNLKVKKNYITIKAK